MASFVDQIEIARAELLRLRAINPGGKGPLERHIHYKQLGKAQRELELAEAWARAANLGIEPPRSVGVRREEDDVEWGGR